MTDPTFTWDKVGEQDGVQSYSLCVNLTLHECERCGMRWSDYLRDGDREHEHTPGECDEAVVRSVTAS